MASASGSSLRMEPAVGSLQSDCTRTALLVVSAAVITPVSLSIIMTKMVTCDRLGERESTGLMISQALEKYGALVILRIVELLIEESEQKPQANKPSTHCGAL